ncbi:MAG TPA: DnaJ domain-containing protein [Ktedonobacterales bacterium]
MSEIDHTVDAERADYYAALGVSPTSSPDEIAQAYHHLARQYHPDLHPGDAEAGQRFKAINSAYQTLSDPERRAQYDQQRHQPSPAPTSDGPQVITFERSIDLQNTDIQAVVDELGAAVAGMAAEAADELRGALRDFGAQVDTLVRSAGGFDGNGNRAQRRAAPRRDRRPPPSGPDPQRPLHNGEPPRR